MKKVVHFTESLGGGVIKVLTQLTSVQKQLGYEVEIVYLERTITPSREKLSNIFPNVVLISLGKTGVSGLIKMYFAILREGKGGASILHFHSSWAGAVGRTQLKKKNIKKRFYSPHGFAFQRTDISLFQKRIFNLVEKYLAKFSGVILICYGQAEKNQAVSLSNNEVRVLNHYIEIAKSAGSRIVKDQNDKLNLITIGRITAAKRPDRFAQLARKIGNTVNMIWVGDGDRDSLHVQDGLITITGWVDEKSVNDWLEKSDIFVLLSDWEGLPFSVLEAMSFGVPVVLWDFPGAKNMITDNENGFICANIDELEFKVQTLINDSNKRERFSQLALEKIGNDFSLDKFKLDCEHIYD